LVFKRKLSIIVYHSNEKYFPLRFPQIGSCIYYILYLFKTFHNDTRTSFKR